MTLLTSRPSRGLRTAKPRSMFSLPRTITLLAICALVACAIAPVAASAQGGDSPAGENYVLDVPEAGNGGGETDGDSQKGSGDTGVPAAAADSADEGGLPILLLVLVATAAVGVGIAIVRRRSST
jgi:hypothetical protein